jgi:glyceraldehyde 3-phosphate dehydrogenase
MSKARVAINGFGRIGRTFFRLAYGNPDFEIVAINDLADAGNLAYLLQHDSSYGRSTFDATIKDGAIVVDGKRMRFTSEKELSTLPWKEENIDIVVESTGVFTSYAKAKGHLTAGAKRVVISAPAKDDPAASEVAGATVLMGVNTDSFKTAQITSNASCTTNAASPLIAILKNAIGIEKALLNTVHAYTASQSLVDGPKKDWREGRSAALNIIPSSTGAAIATTLAHTELKGKFDGISMRVPVAVGSIVDITFLASRKTTVEEVNQVLKDAALSPAWKNIFTVTEDPVVSSDIVGAPYGAIADLSFTRVVDGDLVKVLAWYDNEAGYASTLVAHVASVAGSLTS